jgi:2-methylcitrate dehydratase
VFVKEQNGYEGGLTNPMSWERTVEKFHWLAEGFADDELRSGLIGAVEQLDTSALSDLTDLLRQVRPNAVFPTTHPGIQ